IALAGSGFQSDQDKDETSSPARAVAEASIVPARQLSFEMFPNEIIKLILEGLAKPDLQNLRLVEKKLRDRVTQFVTDIKIPGNLPNEQQFDKFLKELTTAPFWEGKKPSEAFVNLFRHAPIKILNLTSITMINPESLKTLGSIFPLSLESLELGFKNVRDEGVKVLGPYLPTTLHRLDLNNNNIGAEGAKALAQRLPATLLGLSLKNNNIGDEGLAALSEAIQGTDLAYLFVSVPNGSLFRERFVNFRNRKDNPVTIIFL
ncbi:MAG: hypothetical protein ACRCYZ_02730, partial [Alphaproteobacteria bacterium]